MKETQMKKIIITITFLTLFFSAITFAADISITIIIPDQHVNRVQAAVAARLRSSDLCKELTEKQCLKAHFVDMIKRIVKEHEAIQTIQDFESGYSEPKVD